MCIVIEPRIKFKNTRGGHFRQEMAADTHKHLAMLRILYGACSAAVDAFRAADNPVDERLVLDLEAMVIRTRGEIERLSAHLANDA